MTSKIAICLSILPVTNMPSPFLRPNRISTWWLARQENAVVKAYGLNRIRFLHQWRIGLQIGPKWPYACIRLWSPRVLPTGSGKPPAVRVLTCGSVWFVSTTGQKPELVLFWRVVTWPRHRTAAIWPGWNRTAVPNLLFTPLWLQFSMWVLIILQHDQYVDYAELWPLSPVAFRFAIRLIFVEWLWKKAQLKAKFAGFWSRLHEYW